MVSEYNKSMGGVDLFDQLKGFYSIDKRSRRFYMRLVHYLLSVCVINGWLLQRRHSIQRGESHTASQLTLLDFTGSIVQSLTRSAAIDEPLVVAPKKLGRPRKCASLPPPQLLPPAGVTKRQRYTIKPQDDVRTDKIGHWPEYSPQRERCAFCNGGYSRWHCTKCKVTLCLNVHANCFVDYHN
jgi:hypothetical protein